MLFQVEADSRLAFVLQDIVNEYDAMLPEDRPSFLQKITRVVDGGY